MNDNTEEYDADLNSVLESATNEELGYLVQLLVDKLTNSLEWTDAYKRNAPNHHAYVDLIAKEIREFGGNTFMNMVRWGKGPEYHEIVRDVADSLCAPYDAQRPIKEIENSILMVVLERSLQSMSDNRKHELLKECSEDYVESLAGSALTEMILSVFRADGVGAYRISYLVVNNVWNAMVGKKVSLPITAGAGFICNPMSPWIDLLEGILSIVNLPNPATRVTIPAVLYIAMLRKGQRLT